MTNATYYTHSVSTGEFVEAAIKSYDGRNAETLQGGWQLATKDMFGQLSKYDGTYESDSGLAVNTYFRDLPDGTRQVMFAWRGSEMNGFNQWGQTPLISK